MEFPSPGISHSNSSSGVDILLPIGTDTAPSNYQVDSNFTGYTQSRSAVKNRKSGKVV